MSGLSRRPGGKAKRTTMRLGAVALTVALAALVAPPLPAGADTPPLYVALGDSYSAGEGLPPYEPNTDVAGNQCHRSERAYAKKFVQSPAGSRYELLFVACGGARTEHVKSDEQYPGDTTDGQASQLAQRADLAQIATITIGGNDARFGEVMNACIYGRPGCHRNPAYADQDAFVDTTVRPKLAEAYAALRAAAPKARILVLTYPHIFQVDRECRRDYLISKAEKQWLRDRTHHLNEVIAETARAQGLAVVDAETAFAGHEICTAEPWAYGIGEGEGHFHPNEQGQTVLAAKVAEGFGG